MKLSDFDYRLPKELIAQKPAPKRDSSRLLVFDRRSGQIVDSVFKEIEQFLAPNTTLVVNNSKVEKARLVFGNKEVFITQTANDRTFRALVRPGKKFRKGASVEVVDDVSFSVDEVLPDGQRIITSSVALDDSRLAKLRLTPLPPYIAQDESLSERYQTVYADPLGSKAAPTAGLHFSNSLIAQLKKNHSFAQVTLHVGLGTFASVDDMAIKQKKLHSELYSLDAKNAKILNEAAHITAVGTTTTRVMESLRSANTKFQAKSGQTDIFIQPGDQFKAVDSLITNFHLPKSSLLMLVAAFMGYEEMKLVYAHAIKEKYRFYSFGDAMLII